MPLVLVKGTPVDAGLYTGFIVVVYSQMLQRKKHRARYFSVFKTNAKVIWVESSGTDSGADRQLSTNQTAPVIQKLNVDVPLMLLMDNSAK